MTCFASAPGREVYVRRLAKAYRHRVGGGDTIRTTALVHEAYLRLVDIDNVDWTDRVHFFAVCAQLMRRILIDRIRAGGVLKRSDLAMQSAQLLVSTSIAR